MLKFFCVMIVSSLLLTILIDRWVRLMNFDSKWCLLVAKYRRLVRFLSWMRTESDIRELSFGLWGCFGGLASCCCFSLILTGPLNACMTAGSTPSMPNSRIATFLLCYACFVLTAGRLLRFRILVCSFNFIVLNQNQYFNQNLPKSDNILIL